MMTAPGLEKDVNYDIGRNAMPSLAARRRSLFWRIHFWAALIASPFALIAALTGILYIFTPQIEHALYGHLDRVVPTGVVRPLDDAVRAAGAAMPHDAQVRFAVPALEETDSTKVFFAVPQPDQTHADMADGHAAHRGMAMPAARSVATSLQTVYVNPYSLAVLGSMADSDRFGMWSKKLHSSLLQGEGWRWMIELAASWLMVMLVTGVYLWWPRGDRNGLPQAGVNGRTWWSQWHGFLGVAMALVSVVMLTTGLTWSKYAGDQIRTARDAVGQKSPQAPADLRSTVAQGKPLSWQQTYDDARAHAPHIALRLTPPRDENGVWRVNNYDLTQPAKRIDIALDAYSGAVLFRSDWRDQTAFGKATGVGIPFHRGEFGLWNQLLLSVFGVSVLFSLLSGWAMFFKRWKVGAPLLPKLLPGAWRSMPLIAWPIAVVMLIGMPLLLWSAVGVLIVEGYLHARQRIHFTAGTATR